MLIHATFFLKTMLHVQIMGKEQIINNLLLLHNGRKDHGIYHGLDTYSNLKIKFPKNLKNVN